MSKLQDLLKIFRAGTKLKKEIEGHYDEARKKEEQLKALVGSVSDHLGEDFSYNLQNSWDQIESICEYIDEDVDKTRHSKE